MSSLAHITDLWPLLEARAAATPSALFALDEHGRTLSFAEYRDATLRCAAGLAALGIARDVPVSWQLPTRIDALILTAALARLGAVQNPILPILREREVGFITRQIGARHLFVPRVFRGFDFEAMAKQVAAQQPGLAVHCVDGGAAERRPGNASARASCYGSRDRTRALDPLQLGHDRRSQGRAAHRSLGRVPGARDVRGARARARRPHRAGVPRHARRRRELAVRLADVRLRAPGRGDLRREAHAALARGARRHAARARARCSIRRISRRSARLSRRSAKCLPRSAGARKLFPNVRAYPGGGAPKPPQLFWDLLRETGAPIASGYGLTEHPIAVMGSVRDPHEKLAATEGRASRGTQLRLVKLDGADAAPGEEGEVRVRGPHLFRGYVDAALDADAIDERGFLRTGDLGVLDAEGYLSITGRLKDIIIRKGENISAKEIEDHLPRTRMCGRPR